MYAVGANSIRKQFRFLVTIALLVSMAVPSFAGGKKKKEEAPAAPPEKNWYEKLDLSKFVWPPPPSIPRLKYMDYFCCQKEEKKTDTKKKSSWMDRMAGGETEKDKNVAKPRWGLWYPYGLAVDSKGKVYVADYRVGAIFIFNTENKDLEMIKNGADANFGMVMGLAMDDNDRLFVSDPKLKRIHVFNPNHKLEGHITGVMQNPCGMAIDFENRFLYVVDTDLDQVLVYDADSFKLLRRIGTTGKNHTLTGPGEFSKPTNVAVDKEGNVYVTDTLNNRVEEFDAEGNFIREFGKAGDGPGKFARPKGIAVNSDGFIWVADSVQDRIQLFTPEGQLLMYIGGHGKGPGRFNVVAGIAVDKQNRVFTSEEYPGRVQMFRYFTQAEAKAELAKREAEAKKSEAEKNPKPASDTKTAEKPQGSSAN